ncbi:MAG: hypothetical protein Q8L41_14695 [Anaerolineales bacterium]|nr:hypothetical protein [Anaerolineales bacterium]
MSLTDQELEQRKQAARTHGAFAIMAHGEKALTEEQKPLLVELREKVQDREGVLELSRDLAAKSVLIAEILTSYIIEEAKAGVPLEEIAALNKLPAFYNSAQRALKNLLDETPKGKPNDSAELTRIKDIVDAA